VGQAVWLLVVERLQQALDIRFVVIGSLDFHRPTPFRGWSIRLKGSWQGGRPGWHRGRSRRHQSGQRNPGSPGRHRS